jgi:hypothetical protein
MFFYQGPGFMEEITIDKPTPKFSLTRLLFWIAGIQVGMSLSVWGLWLWTGNEGWIRYFYDYQSPLFFVGFGNVEMCLCYMAWRQFTGKEPMRFAWFSIMLAATCRFIGFVFSQVLGKDVNFNPLFWADLFPQTTVPLCRKIGLIMGGPIHMVMLAIGLLLVLRAYRVFGLIRRLNILDYAMLSMVSLYVLKQFQEMLTWMHSPKAAFSIEALAGWATDPLLCLLLFEAIFIRRVTVNMGWGLISKCWGSFTAAIFITSVGDMGIWATNWGYLPWPASSVVWHIWFLASCAYAVAPAYQVEAGRRANHHFEYWRKVRVGEYLASSPPDHPEVPRWN